MRVAIYWEQVGWGGVDSHLLELLSRWPSETDDFVIFCNRGNLGYERIKDDLACLSNVEIRQYTPWSYSYLISLLRPSLNRRVATGVLYLMRPVLFFVEVVRIKRLISKDEPYHCMIATNGGYPAAWGALSAIVASKVLKISRRVMIVHHEALVPGPLMRTAEWLVDEIVGRSAQAIVCVSFATKAKLLQNRFFDDHRTRMPVIHNGINPRPGVKWSEILERLNRRPISGGTYSLGIIGRIERYKGHEDVIVALSKIPTPSRFHLFVVGHGSQEEIERLTRLAERCGVEQLIEFVGYLPGNGCEIARCLDLLVMPTQSFEGFGLSLVEALSVGTPVIATNVGAVPEFFDKECGHLVSANSAEEIAVGLMSFLENNEMWRSRAKVAAKEFDTAGTVMASKYHALIHQLLPD